jgi:hypothetical protein
VCGVVCVVVRGMKFEEKAKWETKDVISPNAVVGKQKLY